jgi:hypothetical protein
MDKKTKTKIFLLAVFFVFSPQKCPGPYKTALRLFLISRPRFSKNNHFPQKQAAAKVYHCYAILTLFAEFRL